MTDIFPSSKTLLGVVAALLFMMGAAAAQDNPNAPAGFVLVEAGSFIMGSAPGEPGRDGDEIEHQVTISRDYYIAKYEVTQAEYAELTGTNPSNFIGPNLPVHNVNWFEAIEFCNLLSEHEGLAPCYAYKDGQIFFDPSTDGYRLPTEAEWEYAARSGNRNRGYTFSGSNDIDTAGWYSENSGLSPQPVGLKLPDDLGIYDMTGNISEWCWDWYAEYPTEDVADPSGPYLGVVRVERGGGWYSEAIYCRNANRNGSPPFTRSAGLGFRLVRNIPFINHRDFLVQTRTSRTIHQPHPLQCQLILHRS